jgi:polyisoprenoid-binding protein YceI
MPVAFVSSVPSLGTPTRFDMGRKLCVRLLVVPVLTVLGFVAAPIAASETPLAIDSGRITISGTSNIHAYTASTTAVRVLRAQVSGVQAGESFLENATKPGTVEAFEISIPAATLKSTKDGLDKNMYKALKVQQHPDITFRLVRFETSENAAGSARAIGMLRVAGIEREVALDLKIQRAGSTLSVKGEVELLMTDYGITPPKAMLGMLRTDPKVNVTFETVIAIALT